MLRDDLAAASVALVGFPQLLPPHPVPVPAVLAAGAAALAVLIAGARTRPPHRSPAPAHPPGRGSVVGGPPPAWTVRRFATWSVVGGVACGVVAALAGPAPGHVLVVCATAALLVGAALAGWRRRQRERAATATRRAVVAFAEAVVGELDAGLPPSAALARGVDRWPEARGLVSAVELGTPVAEALRDTARLAGAQALARLGDVWTLMEARGTGLADGLRRVADTCREEQAAGELLRSELASARATARLLAVLPVVVLLAAQGLGTDPVGFLLGTGGGAACLAAGVAWGLLGLWWVDRIAHHALGSPP